MLWLQVYRKVRFFLAQTQIRSRCNNLHAFLDFFCPRNKNEGELRVIYLIMCFILRQSFVRVSLCRPDFVAEISSERFSVWNFVGRIFLG